MENKILELLARKHKACSLEEIANFLKLNNLEERNELSTTITKLETELKIYRSNKDNFMLFDNATLKPGRLTVKQKGYGFVDIEGDQDVFVAPTNMNGAIHADQVIVEITSKKGIQLEGRIVKILERNLKQMVGEFYYKAGIGYIDLDEDNVKLNVQIDPSKTMGAVNGHKVLVKLTDHLKDNNYCGEIVKILGHKNDPGVDVLSIAYKYEFDDIFPDEVMAEVAVLPTEVTEAEKVGRRDLRNEEIFTIDGDDAKDIDDAVSLKILPNGNYLLGVHIADVSHYVKPGSAIDREAYLRGTSVYLADRVLPMLPHKLSNGICSLNGNVDRLAQSCDIEYDHNGKVINYDIYQSLINSKKRMTYNCVNEILEKNIVPEGYESFPPTLRKMLELANLLRKTKEERGMIDFNIDESKILVDDTGKAIDVVLRERGTGEKLIEDFMIAANEAVASHFTNMDWPTVYRIHGEPDKEKIQKFLKFVSLAGYKIDGNVRDTHPKTMQKILAGLQDKKEYFIFARLLLRSMQKAVYDKVNIGHYGLASKDYLHYTSPIRRYPDLIVHRLLDTFIFENHIDIETIKYWDQALSEMALHSSQKERDSVECEREVDDMKKAEYMMQHINEEFTGMISSNLSFGMFVELPNLIEGLVRLETLNVDKKERFYYDDTTSTIVSNLNARGYHMGDIVQVKVLNASKEARTIDFAIVKPVKKQDGEQVKS